MIIAVNFQFKQFHLHYMKNYHIPVTKKYANSDTEKTLKTF